MMQTLLIFSLATAIPLILTILIVLIHIYRPRGVLSFHALNEEEQDVYLNLVNRVDTRLMDKFLRSLPLKIGLMLLTGGVSFWFSGARWLWKLGEKGEAISNTKQYVESKRKRYRHKEVNWDTFPGAHIIMGGKKRISTRPATLCPICKKMTLQQFLADSRREILSCHACGKNIVIKRSESTGRPENLLIPGFYALIIPASGDIYEALHDAADPAGIFDMLGDLLDFIG